MLNEECIPGVHYTPKQISGLSVNLMRRTDLNIEILYVYMYYYNIDI